MLYLITISYIKYYNKKGERIEKPIRKLINRKLEIKLIIERNTK
jgi:hypothetical protein